LRYLKKRLPKYPVKRIFEHFNFGRCAVLIRQLTAAKIAVQRMACFH
jgi:hypothetical protein